MAFKINRSAGRIRSQRRGSYWTKRFTLRTIFTDRIHLSEGYETNTLKRLTIKSPRNPGAQQFQDLESDPILL